MRRALRFVAFATLAAALAAVAFAQSPAYPTKPIKLIVPFPPGGGSDLTARLLAQKMSESMGQPVVVDNKPGANGSIGANLVAKATPDGYTIFLGASSIHLAEMVLREHPLLFGNPAHRANVHCRAQFRGHHYRRKRLIDMHQHDLG